MLRKEKEKNSVKNEQSAEELQMSANSILNV
jgi:hypothetical protein